MAFLLAAPSFVFAGPVAMAPHKALYALSLDEANEGASVGAVDGAIYLKWAETCEGYVTDQRILTRLWGGEGEVGTTDLTSNSFEARDFSTLRFSMTTKTDDEIVDRVEGAARKGSPGEIVYRAPRKAKGALDARAVFPNELSYKVLDAALAGEHWVDVVLFEGGEADEIYHVVVFIGAKKDAAAGRPEGDPSLQVLDGIASWPVTLSYYDLAVGEGVARYEVRFRLYANGVSDEVHLDYGDFSVFGRLQSIELLALPKC
ncbi:MAG: DUF1849 family protein [Alphaproteobacteria bacterium]|nr:DUF1849 family protein [Alphaproteobacteria bacterium]